MNRTAVIVAIGELSDRVGKLEPRALIAEAVRLADHDAGGGFVSRADRIDVVSVASFAYLDLPSLVAADIGASPTEAAMTPLGGDMPVKALAEAAAAIEEGRLRIAILCGGEALKTRMKAASEKRALDWGPADTNAPAAGAADHVTPLAARYRLTHPAQIYPLFENAYRESLGQSIEEGQCESAELWATLSEIAGGNENAWTRRAMSAADIATVSADNRPIAFPYPKLMNAQLGVNQACAVIITDVETARAAGISEERMIHVGAAVRAVEPRDFLARDRFDHSPAQHEVLEAVLDANGVSAGDIDLLELYSCFPVVPKMARRLIGLRADIAPSVTGGLTFFGGPANNYMTHAIAAAVRQLRQGAGSTALLYGQGEFVTKHAAIILSARAGARAALLDVQAAADARRGPVPPLRERYSGPAELETYTILFDRNGDPEWAPVVLRTPAGERVLAKAGDDATIAVLMAAETGTIGRTGTVDTGSEDRLVWTL